MTLTVERLLMQLPDAHIVGGAVRDEMMGKEPKDIDVCCSMPPQMLLRMFPESFDSGAAFGTVSIKTSDAGFVEVTTFRKDMGAGRHPEVEFTDNFAEDAGRRDFTINAMGKKPNGEIVDLFGGIADIENRIIRCVGNPRDRLDYNYGGDPLRAMRAVRFALRLDFDIDAELADVIREIDLSMVANERIWKEISLMLEKDAVGAIEIMDEFNLLQKVLPEVVDLKPCIQPVEHHPKDRTAFVHTLKVMEALQNENVIVKVMGLLHDIGKRVVMDGESYNGHDKAGVPIAEAILRRFGRSKDEIKAVCFVVENHMKMHRFFEMKKSKQIALFESPYFDMLLKIHDADVSMRPNMSQRKEILELKDKFMVEKAMPKPIINGKDVLAHADIKGKDIGIVLEELWEAQLEGAFVDKKGGIKRLRKLLRMKTNFVKRKDGEPIWEVVHETGQVLYVTKLPSMVGRRKVKREIFEKSWKFVVN